MTFEDESGPLDPRDYRRRFPRSSQPDVDYHAIAARLITSRTRPVVDPELQPTREIPSMADLNDSDLATKAASILMDEITNGASLSPRIPAEARQTLSSSLRWLLKIEDPASYSVQTFPGNAKDDVLGKEAVLSEFVARLQNRRGGELDG